MDWFIDRMATMFNISGEKIPADFCLFGCTSSWRTLYLIPGDLTVCAVVGDKVIKNLEAKGAPEEDEDDSTQKDFAWSLKVWEHLG